jgi:CDP-paratose 2-epimerase
MRILITGGAGFIGSNIAVALKTRFRSSRITCLDNLYRQGSRLNLPRLHKLGIDFMEGDVRHAQSFPSKPFDIIIESSAEPSVLAGYGSSPDYAVQTNLLGAYNCLEKAREWHSTFLFLSTSRVYPIQPLQDHAWVELPTRFSWKTSGDGISPLGVAESIDLRGARSIYGATKLAAELLIEEYRAAFQLNAIVNRCGVVAGPWQFGKVDQGVVALWVMAHYFKKNLSYVGFGGRGKQVRDVLHVDDLCDLIIDQVTHASTWDGWVGNVSGTASNSVSLLELTELCRDVVSHKIPIGSVPANRPFDLRIYFGDCRLLFARTNWRPTRDLRQIIQDVYQWVERNREDVSALPF